MCEKVTRDPESKTRNYTLTKLMRVPVDDGIALITSIRHESNEGFDMKPFLRLVDGSHQFTMKVTIQFPDIAPTGKYSIRVDSVDTCCIDLGA